MPRSHVPVPLLSLFFGSALLTEAKDQHPKNSSVHRSINLKPGERLILKRGTKVSKCFDRQGVHTTGSQAKVRALRPQLQEGRRVPVASAKCCSTGIDRVADLRYPGPQIIRMISAVLNASPAYDQASSK